MFFVLSTLNKIRWCTLLTVIETIICNSKVDTIMRHLHFFNKDVIHSQPKNTAKQ